MRKYKTKGVQPTQVEVELQRAKLLLSKLSFLLVPNQNVDFPIANKLREGCVHFIRLRDISGCHKYVDAGELVLDGGFSVEKGLFSSAKERDSGCASFGEAASGLCTDASTPSCYHHSLAFRR